jgi:hypothetical protein
MRWLVGETTASFLGAGAFTVMAASLHPAEQGRTPLSVEHRHWLSGVLLYAGACLGFLIVVMPVSAC